MKVNNNKRNHNDKIIDKLYQQVNQDLPPSAVDQLILNQAKSSSQLPTAKNNWRPWLAAASVLIALPMIWFLTQNNELTQNQTPLPSVPAPQSKATEQSIPDGEDIAEMVEPATSRPYAAPAMADDRATDQDQSMAAEKSTNSGQSTNQSSLEVNRQLLKDELKAKKKTIKQSNLDPMMALELQQFEQYLEENQLDKAEQLLIEMRRNYPDFNYDDLIETLQVAKNNL